MRVMAKGVFLVVVGMASGGTLAAGDVAPIKNEAYKNECGSCHVPYSPGLLPARSWQKVMSNLTDHFGDNAELPAEERKALTDYLVSEAADKSNYKRSVKIMDSLSSDETPIRITEIKYIVRKHGEVPKRLIVDNPDVRSLSRCDACHPKAVEGSYAEGEVRIPGAKRWEDD